MICVFLSISMQWSDLGDSEGGVYVLEMDRQPSRPPPPSQLNKSLWLTSLGCRRTAWPTSVCLAGLIWAIWFLCLLWTSSLCEVYCFSDLFSTVRTERSQLVKMYTPGESGRRPWITANTNQMGPPSSDRCSGSSYPHQCMCTSRSESDAGGKGGAFNTWWELCFPWLQGI